MKNEMLSDDNSLRLDIINFEQRIIKFLQNNNISAQERSILKYEIEQMIDNISFVLDRCN